MSAMPNQNRPKQSELQETAKEAGGSFLCGLISIVAPFVGLSYNTEKGFHINVVKAVIWVVVLLVLLFGLTHGNILMAYLLTCVASVAWKLFLSNF